MKFGLVLGNNHTDVIRSQVYFIRKGIAEGRRQLVVVPDRFSLSMEKMLLEELGTDATFNLEVLTFPRLANLIISSFGSHTVLTSQGAVMVIQMLLNKHADELTCFKTTAKTVSFASVLFDSVAQIKSCNISPAELRASAQAISSQALRSKIEDIAFIYEKYEEYITDGYIDSNNRLELLCEKLQYSDVLKNADLYFCHFDSLTPQGYQVIAKLLHRAGSVNVGILEPEAGQPNANVYYSQFHRAMLDIAYEERVTPFVINAKCSLSGNRRHILRNLYAHKPEVTEIEGDGVELHVAGNPRAEVEWVAKDIARRIRAGRRYRDININCTDLQAYESLFTQAFDRYGIPHYIDVPFSLLQSEGYKFVALALECVADGFRQEDVLRYVKNCFSGLSESHQSLFENVTKRYGISGAMFSKALNNIEFDPEFGEFEKIKLGALGELNAFAKNLKSAGTVGEVCVAVEDFCKDAHLQDKLKEMAKVCMQNRDLRGESIFRQTHKKLDSILAQMRDILWDVKCTLPEFISILSAGAATVNISPLPMSLDCVYVGQSLQSVFAPSPIYYIVGASDGNFPAWVMDVGLISDTDIMSLGEHAVNIVPTIREVNALSRQNVLLSLSLATEVLILTYPAAMGQDECKPCTAMIYLSEIFRNSGKTLPISNLELSTRQGTLNEQLKTLAFHWVNMDNMLRAIVLGLGDANCDIPSEVIATAFGYLREHGYGEKLDVVINELNSEFDPENLTNGRELFFRNGTAKVTEIERYYNCPYMHFVEYGLRLRAQDSSRIDVLDTGNILHAVAEEFGKVLQRRGVMSEREAGEYGENIFEKIINKDEYKRLTFSGRNSSMLESLKDEAGKLCQAVNYQQTYSKYEIKYIEASFGEHGVAPNPVIKIDGHEPIVIRGKVDRVDVWGDKIRLIDYKTSRSAGKFEISDLFFGKKIQLFYYLASIVEGMKSKGQNLNAAGAYYLPIHREYTEEKETSMYSRYRMDGVTLNELGNLLAQDERVNFEFSNSDIIKFGIKCSEKAKKTGEIETKSSKSLVTDAQLDNLLQYSKQILKGAVEDILDGIIFARPIGRSCEFCEYAKLCKVKCCAKSKQRRTDYKIKLLE